VDTSILILGTGALATLFAARLASAGAQVTLLGSWLEAVQALNTHGVRLIGLDGKEQVASVRATDNASECRQASLALVLVKAWQTERAAGLLEDCLSADSLAVTLQNGLGNRETLARTIGPQRVAIGVTTMGATLLGPGIVRVGGEGTISLEAHPRIGPLEESLRLAGFEVSVVEDAISLLWGKLVINAAINPLTALVQVPNGELLQRPSLLQLMIDLATEVAVVARAYGIALPFDDPAEAAMRIAQRTALNRSSMLQDVLRGAPTEIDAICGEVVRLGEAKGVPTPVNRAMWSLVRGLRD